jgi:phosphoglucosamine mutase
MTTKYFGTDGVRGIAYSELTSDMAYALGKAAVELLGPVLVIGRDTRVSGQLLENALLEGAQSVGGVVWSAGIVPTPAVALLTRERKANGGVVISASHNPPEYNGIKFFDAEGFKLSEALEQQFEQRLQALGAVAPSAAPDASPEDASSAAAATASPAAVPVAAAPAAAATTGSAAAAPPAAAATATPPATPTPVAAAATAAAATEAAERYIRHALDIVQSQNIDFKGLTVAVDTGFGAAGYTTPAVLRQLGAEVVAINTDFDGARINVGCGSTHLGQLKALVASSGADLGIAHDGDADRMLAVDASGNELDGDIIEAICALDLKRQGRLVGDTVVSTVVCNLGFIRAMQENGIDVVKTAVGDSHVLAAMRQGGYVIGGEQSGHMILLEHNSTGDGLVTALQLLMAIRRSGKTLEELSQVMVRYPQVTINVPVANKYGLESSQAIKLAMGETEQRLGDQGRILLRASGTEALVRVMVEAADQQQADDEARKLAELVKQELG